MSRRFTPSPHHITLPLPTAPPLAKALLGSVTALYLLRFMIYDQNVYNFEVLPRNILSANSDYSCIQIPCSARVHLLRCLETNTAPYYTRTLL